MRTRRSGCAWYRRCARRPVRARWRWTRTRTISTWQRRTFRVLPLASQRTAGRRSSPGVFGFWSTDRRQPTSRASYEGQIQRGCLLEDALALGGRECPERAEQAAEHSAVIVEHRVVAVLEQRAALQALLCSGDA